MVVLFLVAYVALLIGIHHAQDEAARRYAEWCNRMSYAPPYYDEMCIGDSGWMWGAIDMSHTPLPRAGW